MLSKSKLLMQVKIQRNQKALVVDDDDDTRLAIRLALQEYEYLHVEVTESKDAASAVKILNEIHPDIIILDLHLPDKSGFDVMDIIVKNKPFAQTHVIMITADNTIGNVFEAEARGIATNHFLGKPFNISDLQALVLNLSLSA